MLIISRYVVTTCEIDYYILIIFVVISKKEESIYRKRLYILMVLGRISTSLNSVESFNRTYSSYYSSHHSAPPLLLLSLRFPMVATIAAIIVATIAAIIAIP